MNRPDQKVCLPAAGGSRRFDEGVAMHLDTAGLIGDEHGTWSVGRTHGQLPSSINAPPQTDTSRPVMAPPSIGQPVADQFSAVPRRRFGRR
jgi:hypothetical protein